QLAWVQLLGWTAVTPAQLDLIAGLLGGSTELDGLAVDTELRWALLRRLAATGRADAAAIDAEAARDATDAGIRHAAACRAAMPEAGRKAEAWRQLVDSEELGIEGMMAVAGGFAQPEHIDLLRPYAERYFEVLPGLWSARADVYRRILGAAIFPHYAASPELLARLDAFLAAEERDPALVRLLVEHRDMVERALRARSLPQ
ncbi:MAG TPA: ERAP1-like C-terminal domain-containing protein, partial [Micromonosporaceae bacterium]